jgi:hypothetical protein
MTDADRDHRYLARAAAWDWHDAATIDILDEQGDVVRTLDQWQTLVFHEADANRTVAQLVAWLEDRPAVDAHGRPADDPVGSVTQALAALTDDLGLVELRDAKADLPPEHDLPRSKRDLFESER